MDNTGNKYSPSTIKEQVRGFLEHADQREALNFTRTVLNEVHTKGLTAEQIRPLIDDTWGTETTAR